MTEKVFEGDPTTPAIQRVIETLGCAAVQTAPETTDSYTPEKPSMEASRPDWLVQAIDSEFADVGIGTRGYASHGTRGDYFFGHETATKLIADYRVQRRQGGPLRILDVGTGVGGFLTRNDWPSGDVVHGLTGFDYRIDPTAAFPKDKVQRCLPSKDDPRYLVGNAEHLDRIDGLLPEYDVIVSKTTVQHFVDGLGSLEAIANRVAPGGMLCLDAGRYYKAHSLLLQNGFVAVDVPGSRTDDEFDSNIVLIRVGDKPVRFGLGYEQKEPGYETELELRLKRPLTPHDTHTLSWTYADPG
jgi:SAM-dependent methyltransferase